ncbi:unnamed protein product [Moneuplotes crassus]|uniref:Uncharacterized protein n=1 Tax=Euplotes crassus TaxID=5936 RepID=A0AAD1U1R9_EUPCR|nr:unnamed protein product [Moneuplotes crassus]
MVAKSHSKKLFRRKKTIAQRLFNAVKAVDMYGKDIVLTYDGDDKYRTHIGGVASIIVFGIVFSYIIYLIQLMFSKGDTTFIKTSLLNDLYENVEIHTPAKNGGKGTGYSAFDFAFKFTADGKDYLTDSTAFSLSMNFVEQKWVTENGVAKIERNYTNIEYEICGLEHFNYDDVQEIQRIGVDTYYCPKGDYSVAGSFYSPQYNYVEMKLRKCVGATCMSSTDIENLVKDSRFSMAIVNTVVDLKNYQKPIQYMIDDGLFWELTPGIRKKTDVFIRKNEASFEDNYVQLGFPQEKEFYQVAESTDRFESESSQGDILSIYFRFDKTSDIYERKIYSLGELIGQAGGFYTLLSLVGSILLFIFSERLFVSSILAKIYQIDKWQEQERLDKNLALKNQREISKKNLEYKEDGRRIKQPFTKSEKFHSQTTDCLKHIDSNDVLDISLLPKMEKSMRERRVFKYGYIDILHYLFCCVVCRRKRSMRLKPRFRDHLYYEIGEEKLLDELDCVTIIKAVRQLKILTHVLFDKKQKFLMKFQRNNVIDSSSSGTSDEGQMNIVDLMASKNEKHVKIVNKKIQKAIYSIQGRHLKELDKRIIAGIFKKRQSDSENENEPVQNNEEELRDLSPTYSNKEEHKQYYPKFKRSVRVSPLFSKIEIGDSMNKISEINQDPYCLDKPNHYYDNESCISSIDILRNNKSEVNDSSVNTK